MYLPKNWGCSSKNSSTSSLVVVSACIIVSSNNFSTKRLCSFRRSSAIVQPGESDCVHSKSSKQNFNSCQKLQPSTFWLSLARRKACFQLLFSVRSGVLVNVQRARAVSFVWALSTFYYIHNEDNLSTPIREDLLLTQLKWWTYASACLDETNTWRNGFDNSDHFVLRHWKYGYLKGCWKRITVAS